MQDTWLDDFDESQECAYFAVSPKGWTNDQLGVSWLEKVFDRHTKKTAGNRYRLLILDGHSSHVSMDFLNYCETACILVVVLPLHLTHRLQPLDVSVFSSLVTKYSQELDKLM